ncbi:MAG: hypothetical protein QXM96_02505 [Candidatus Woesearchaeota archaeon]
MHDKYEIDFIADKVIQVVDDNKKMQKRKLNNGLKPAKELKKRFIDNYMEYREERKY